jgi:hypothetical protein
MKKAKPEDLQKVIEDYMRKRNYANTNETKNTSSIQEIVFDKLYMMESNNIDLNYYGDISEAEYLKQYRM